MSRVVMYGKPGCHLCDDAREIIRAVCAEAGVEWSEVDITQDDRLDVGLGREADSGGLFPWTGRGGDACP